eukprot:363918-Chlamydomonas_euryale.AAC.9
MEAAFALRDAFPPPGLPDATAPTGVLPAFRFLLLLPPSASSPVDVTTSPCGTAEPMRSYVVSMRLCSANKIERHGKKCNVKGCMLCASGLVWAQAVSVFADTPNETRHHRPHEQAHAVQCVRGYIGGGATVVAQAVSGDISLSAWLLFMVSVRRYAERDKHHRLGGAAVYLTVGRIRATIP